MANVRHAILATLAYYDIFDIPLTPLEAWRYLVNPARLEKLPVGVEAITLGTVAEELDQMAKIGRIACRDGLYCLSAGRVGIISLRIAREKISAQKWKKMLRIAYWFQAVPYVRGLFASGSLAANNTTPESDWDVLTIIRAGRLYTGRILLALAASAFGARRTRHDRTAPDKFCFNHYLTSAALAIPAESMYNAQTYARLVPILSHDDAWGAFYRANAWISKFAYHATARRDAIRRSVPPSRILLALARAGEWLLGSFAGDWLEERLKSYQQRRIRENPVTHAAGGRVIASDSQLEFHPHSAERSIIERYVKGIRNLGIIPYMEEVDSLSATGGLQGHEKVV